MTIDQRRFSGLMLKAVLAALILTPPIKIVPGVPAIRVDEVLLVVWGVLSFTLWRGRGVSTYVPMLLPLTMFFALIPLSILNGMWHGFAVSFGDLNQIIRI